MLLTCTHNIWYQHSIYRVTVPPHLKYQNKKKLAQPTRCFFTLKISRKTVALVLLHPLQNIWELSIFQNVFFGSLCEAKIELISSCPEETRRESDWPDCFETKSRSMFCFQFNLSKKTLFNETESENHISCCGPDFIFLRPTDTANKDHKIMHDNTVYCVD